ncbi:MAG: carbohydrate ABC transporter permease [Candidatus Methanomethylicia archaeon]
MSVEEVAEKQTISGWILILIGLVLTLFPIFWIISTSLKSIGEWVTYPPIFIPEKLAIDNYISIFTGGALGGGFVARVPNVTKSIIDSAICSAGGTILSLVIGLLAAFGISRYRMGGEFFPIFLLAARMAPPIVAAIPLLILYSIIGLVDTYIGLILAYACFTSPYSTWMIASFIEEIPKELEEAAQIDGMSALESHFKVTLPLIRGGIAATALFVFILNWCEFLLALILTHGAIITIPVQVKNFFTYSGQLYGPQAAFGTVVVIPLIVFSLIIQKHLVRGLTFGAIRG